MVILELFSKSLKIKYKNHLCSKATLFIIFTKLITILVPFLFAYRSRGFWLKHDTFYEHPSVRFMGEYLFVGYTNNLNHPIICNNFPYYQQHNNFDLCSVIKVREIDNNLDGKIDELYFSLNVNLPNDTKLLALNLMLTIDYRLHTTCPLHMQSAIILQELLNNFVTILDITSKLQLSQTYPLFCYLKGKDVHYNHSVIENFHELESYKFENIIGEYHKRNISTHLTNIYRTFDAGVQSKFEIRLKVRYPEHQIYYKPGFWQIIKWALIQYSPVYIVFAWFMKIIKRYVFEKHLVLFYEVSPLKKET